MSNNIEVPFSDDQSEEVSDDQLIVEADKPGDSPEIKAQRAQRRRERAQERERERKEQAEQLVQLRAEIAQERAERARLQGFVQALPAAQQQPGKDPYEEALDNVYARRKQAFDSMQAELKAGTMDEKKSQHFERESRVIEGEIARIHAQRAIDSRTQEQRREAAQQPYIHKHPEVYNHKAAYSYAQGEYAKRVARAPMTGEQITNDTIDEIMEETKAVFKLGKKSAPSKSERDKLSGMPASGGGGGSGDGRAGIAKDKALVKMAVAKYGGPGISDDQAFQKWVDREGKELRRQKVL